MSDNNDNTKMTTTTNNDPFAPRQGRHLRWRNVHMTVQSNNHGGSDKTTATKTILDHVWGEVPPGETTAILGPSGSGKTSLLNILSGRATSGKNISISADVRLNNFPVNPADIHVRQAIAFVAQDDSLQATATVREAIMFSAKLRLPKSNTDEDLDHLVTRMMEELGLQRCADTIVGSALIKGISGGERKRTSVGVELVTRPPLVFLDEPTSGLDSYSAMQLCKVLKKVATAGSSVLFTIHQPSSDIFKSFDHVVLLKQGRILYNGSVSSVSASFADRGHPVPAEYNPADWIMDVAQAYTMEELQNAGFFPDSNNGNGDDWGAPAVTTATEEKQRDALGTTLHEQDQVDTTRLGWLGQTQLLFVREVTNFRRNKHALKARTAMTVAISLFIGIIFYQVAQTSFDKFINVQSSFGAVLMSLLANVFSTTLPSLLVFPQERPVFLREYSTDHYGVVAYFMSRLTMEFIVTAVQVTVSSLITYFMVGFDGNFGIFYLVVYLLAMTSTALGVLLGSSAEDPNTAMELLPGAIMPQILFAGFFVPPELMPNWLAWIRFICPLTYAVRIALVNEFDEGRCSDYANEVDSNGGEIPNYCHQVLENVDVDPDETWWNWVVLVGMFVVLRLLALINLRRKANKFY